MLLTQPLDLESGSRCHYHFALQKAVAAKVSKFCRENQLEGLPLTGVVTSPNYPGNYPDNVEKTHTIQVKPGLILSLEFTAFNIEPPLNRYNAHCSSDHLTIMDGDGTTLMERSCGPFSADGYDVESDNKIVIGGRIMNSSLPANLHSRSNIVKLFFITNSLLTKTGWSINWNAVTPGVVTPGESFTLFISLSLIMQML